MSSICAVPDKVFAAVLDRLAVLVDAGSEL
jgi:hypothetical protein